MWVMLGGCQTDVLLRQQETGLCLRSFSLNSQHYSPQMIESIGSIPHSPCYEPLTRISHQDLDFWGKLAKQVGRAAAEA